MRDPHTSRPHPPPGEESASRPHPPPGEESTSRPHPPPGEESASRPHPPPGSWDHILRLTDDTGILEHAMGPIPRREHGYTTDDNARALMLAVREPDPPEELVGAAVGYLAFLLHARLEDGRFRNRLGYDRVWRDQGESDDASGRAVWALAYCSTRASSVLAEPARQAIEQVDGFVSRHLRAACFGVLAGAELLSVDSYDRSGSRLLEANLEQIRAIFEGADRDEGWPWPESALRYDNARIPQALIAAGTVCDDEDLLEEGLALLRWLEEIQTRHGHLSVVSHRGWTRGGPRPRFDQQPIELAALAEAGTAAWEATADERWLDLVSRAWAWFEGDNDLGTRMYDPLSWGGYDGLTPEGPNRNQGAESTISMLTTLQLARVAVRHSELPTRS